MRRIIFLIVVLTVAVFTIGCTNSKEGKETKEHLYSVVDARGKTIEFDYIPQRIFATDLFTSEILVDLVEHKKIIAISKWTRDPNISSVSKKTLDIKNDSELDVEYMKKLKADLVLLPHTSKAELINLAEDVGLKVYVYEESRSLSGIEKRIREVANAIHEDKKGEELIRQMNNSLKEVSNNSKKLPKLKALVFLRFGAVGGKGSVYNETIKRIGCEDCYEKVRFGDKINKGTLSILSKEEVIMANPDLIILGKWTPSSDYKIGDEQVSEMYGDPAYKTVNAIKNKKIVVVPQRYLNSLSQNSGADLLWLQKRIYEVDKEI